MADNNKQLQLTPSTAIEFFNVPWDINYNHVVKFDNIQAQNNYFSTPAKTVNESTFMTIEPMSLLRIDAVVDWILQSGYNYCRFRNFNVNVAEYRPDRWYYAFIKNARWASNNSTFIDIELDVYQTFLFDFTLFPSFVEREHIANDTIGANTVDENIATGLMKCYAQYEKESISNMGCLVCSAPAQDEIDYIGAMYSGIWTSLMYFYFPPDHNTEFSVWLHRRKQANEGIAGITMIPDEFVGISGEGDILRNQGIAGWAIPWDFNTVLNITQGPLGTYSHDGQYAIDFSAPIGTPIYSPATGIVIKIVRNHAEIGNSVTINITTDEVTGEDYNVLYHHLSSIDVIVGQIVDTRSVVGRTGNTGSGSGPHLHLEIKHSDGTTPYELMSQIVMGHDIMFWRSEVQSVNGNINDPSWGNEQTQHGEYYVINSSDKAGVKYFEIPKYLSDLDGYVPKNNKLFCFPYSYITASNNNGASKEYRYERMQAGDVFRVGISCDVSTSPTLFMFPDRYNGIQNNYDEGLRLSGFPQVPAKYGAFESWLAQNAGSIIMQAGLSLAGVALAAATGGASSAITAAASMSAGIASGVANTNNPFDINAISNRMRPTMAGIEANKINMSGSTGQGLLGVASNAIGFFGAAQLPDLAKGSISGSALTSQKKMNFTFFIVGLCKEYAVRIDRYFDRYGYATNDVKMPNVNSRPYWNYVKTQDVNLHVNAPAVYENVLKSIFNKGVTIWKNPNNIGNFSLNNH